MITIKQLIMTVDGNELNVSLEPHLVERLVPLIQVLPPELAVTLRPYTIEPTPSIIPYSLLVSISQWSRSTPGQTTLHSQVPALNAQDYTMISLLAGSITSPERHFPVHVPKSILAEEERKRQLTDKKAIVTLLNAFLSILGSGVAAWLVAERWRHEWVRSALVMTFALIANYGPLIASPALFPHRSHGGCLGNNTVHYLAISTF